MKLLSSIIIITIATAFLQGCAGASKQGQGALIGGGTGALIGSRFGKGEGALLATGIGALAGAFIGSEIGRNMDETDKMLAARSTQQALEAAPSGQAIAWQNPDNGHKGTIVPKKATQNSQGNYCREYTHSVVIGGKTQQAYGKACRKPDGTWRIVQ